MIRFKIDKAKDLFFDKSGILDAMDKAAKRTLSLFGFQVRRDARKSIRKRRKSIKGRPPRNITGLLKKFIFFVYEPHRQTVVIGPALLAKPQNDVPGLLEEGGTQRATELQRRQAQRGGRNVMRVRYAPHPYMGPALEKNLPDMDRLWADSVKL